MAILVEINCPGCGKACMVSCSAGAPNPKLCNTCAGEAADRELQAHLAECRKVSFDERLSRIEAALFRRSREVPWDGRIG